MKRDRRLHGLSAEHHHALVLARTISERVASGNADSAFAALVARRFELELKRHFELEEKILLPALRAAGELALVTRTEADHAFLRQKIASASRGLTDDLAAFAERLVDHVRFEERQLFPYCEEQLAGDVLDEVARAT